MPDRAARILENAAQVRERIAAAARQSGRAPDDVTLVCVTKYVDADTARILADAGYVNLGESRPQELWSKAESLSDLPIRWHLVGHLQRNKLARTLPLVSLVHSVDSRRLLDALNEQASLRSKLVDVLLEVNISGDVAKHGFAPTELPTLVEQLSNYPSLRIHGLMAMASLTGGRQQARHDFAALRQLRDQLDNHSPSNVSLHELSIGMSEDFDLAIAEGATIVRIGSTLFEGVDS